MKVSLKVLINGKKIEINEKNDDFVIDEYVIEGGKRIVGTYTPSNDVTYLNACLILNQDYKSDDYILGNGYQSWSTSKEYHTNEIERKPSLIQNICERIIKLTGDNRYYKYTGKKGVIHSTSYTYIRNKENIRFYGSLLERKCFTFFESNCANNEIRIIEDIKGLKSNEKRVIFDFIILDGTVDYVFNRYFEELNIKPLKTKRVKGFTSWYNYYKDINEEIILKNLNNFIKFKNEGNDVDIFQIDDGYMYEVGDWKDIDVNKFPHGLDFIADKINEHFDSGLWLAPLTVSLKSKVAKEHKDYLLRDKKGKLVLSFSSCGPCYVLDIYNENARNYIRDFFDVVFNKWHFKMVKLDFLYAECVLPPINKTRAEMMYDSMVFLREVCGDHPILGCGLPLFSGFGLVDYCRVGCDVSLDYGKLLNFNKEGVSTINDMLDSISRYPLSKRAFLTDPDVFLLRSDNIKMTDNEKELLSIVNAIFGDVLFTSDDFSLYPDTKTYEKLKEIWHLNDCKIIKYDIVDGNKIDVVINLDNKEYRYLLNLSDNQWNYLDVIIEPRNYKVIQNKE